MIRTLLRVVLAVLLITTVVGKTQVTSNDHSRDRLISNVLEVLSGHGVSAHANARQTDPVMPVSVQFQAPGCDGPVEVLPVHINLQEAPVFDAVLKPDHVRQFAYLDQKWPSENRLGMRLAWLKHKPLSVLGLGRFMANTLGLLIVSPPGCQAAQSIDWSLVWDRRTMAATGQLASSEAR